MKHMTETRAFIGNVAKWASIVPLVAGLACANSPPKLTLQDIPPQHACQVEERTTFERGVKYSLTEDTYLEFKGLNNNKAILAVKSKTDNEQIATFEVELGKSIKIPLKNGDEIEIILCEADIYGATVVSNKKLLKYDPLSEDVEKDVIEVENEVIEDVGTDTRDDSFDDATNDIWGVDNIEEDTRNDDNGFDIPKDLEEVDEDVYVADDGHDIYNPDIASDIHSDNGLDIAETAQDSYQDTIEMDDGMMVDIPSTDLQLDVIQEPCPPSLYDKFDLERQLGEHNIMDICSKISIVNWIHVGDIDIVEFQIKIKNQPEYPDKSFTFSLSNTQREIKMSNSYYNKTQTYNFTIRALEFDAGRQSVLLEVVGEQK